MKSFMFAVRYLLVFCAELPGCLWNRHHIYSIGYKSGTFSVAFATAHHLAKFCAKYNHPIKYCINRKAWLEWMNEDYCC